MKSAVLIALATVLLFGGPACAAGPGTVATVYTDNLVIDMKVAPQFLWDEIKRMYVDGDKFRHLGFKVTRIDGDPQAYLGGTVAEKTEAGVVDRREAHFTIIDDRQHFLALTAKYLNGPTAYVSYAIRPAAGGGSTFQLIVHAEVEVAVDPGTPPTPASVHAAIDTMAATHHKQLVDIWRAEQTRIEAMASAAAPR